MLEPESELWRWLAEQPAFIEVGIGIAFVLLLAPAVLAAGAWLLTRLEVVVGGIAEGRRPLLRLLLSGTNMHFGPGLLRQRKRGKDLQVKIYRYSSIRGERRW